METVATVCGYCGVGCGMELHVADGVVTKAAGRPDHPANRGRLLKFVIDDAKLPPPSPHSAAQTR